MMAITPAQLDAILDQWRAEYGYGGGSLRATSSSVFDRCGSGGGPPAITRTVADDFNASWCRLSAGSPREYRMAMALRGDVMSHPSDPLQIILERLQRWGIRMDNAEFAAHVGWARDYFCATMELRAQGGVARPEIGHSLGTRQSSEMEPRRL